MAPLSEYRRKFRQKGEASQRDYVVRYNYMVGRRSIEMSHTPIDWEVASDTDSEISSTRSVVAPFSVKSVEERKNVAKKAVNVDESTSTTDGFVTRPTPMQDVAIQCGRNKVKTTGNREEKEENKDKRCQHSGQKSKPHKPAEKRSKSRNDKKASTPSKAPMMPYGWAYRGPIDNHKTFNVKVPEKEASQSALRALKRRQLESERKEELKQKQALEKENTQALFDFVEKDKSGWMSEYQRNFSGYKYNY
eukprot:gene9926-10944_t